MFAEAKLADLEERISNAVSKKNQLSKVDTEPFHPLMRNLFAFYQLHRYTKDKPSLTADGLQYEANVNTYHYRINEKSKTIEIGLEISRKRTEVKRTGKFRHQSVIEKLLKKEKKEITEEHTYTDYLFSCDVVTKSNVYYNEDKLKIVSSTMRRSPSEQEYQRLVQINSQLKAAITAEKERRLYEVEKELALVELEPKVEIKFD